MSNSFNINVGPLISDAVVKILANKTLLDELHNVDLPAIFIKAQSNESKLMIIDDIVDAVKLSTDIIPQNVRSEFKLVYDNTVSDTLVTLLNITGHGKLYKLGIRCGNVDDTVELKVEIDSLASEAYTHTGDVLTHVVIPSIKYPMGAFLEFESFDDSDRDNNLFNVEFSSHLKILFRRSAGTTSAVYCQALYGEDPF